MSDLPALRALGEQFERLAFAAGPAPGRRRIPRGRRALVLALAAAILAAAAAVAASGLLTGEPLRNPAGVTFSPTRGLGTPVPGSVRLSALRVADPAGGPAWGIRALRTTRGLACVQVGRIVGGRIGVLGQDGAFADDGRFHELPPNVLFHADCEAADAAGHGFVSVSYQGLPASAMGGGCVTPDQPPAPPSSAGSPPAPQPRTCPRADERIVYYGLLGPRARSVTYRGDDGRPTTVATSGPEGAYLVVLRPGAQRPARGYFSFGPSPASGLLGVQYRDHATCHIRSPRALGGAKPCPLVGYVAPHTRRVTSAQIAAPVSARFAPRPVLVPGASTAPASIRRSWKLEVSFRARVSGDARSYYVVSVAIADALRCHMGTGSSPIARDLAAGQVVHQTEWIPTRCHGPVRVEVTLHRPDARHPDQMPFAALPGHGPRVGAVTVRIPG